MQQQKSPSFLRRYGVAVLSTTLAFLLRWTLLPVLGMSAPFMQFLPAIALTAWYGGLGPGLLATVLSGLLISYFLLPLIPTSLDQSSLVESSSDGVSLLIFVLIGVLLSVLNESLHRARRQIEEAARRLNENNEHFHLLVESVQDYGIFMLDTGGRVVSWNAGAQRIKGYHADEIIGEHFSRFYSPEDIQHGKPQQELQMAAEQGHIEAEGWRMRQDGSRFWASVALTSIRSETGEPRAFANITRDITQLKHTQEELRERERRLQAVLDNTAISVYIKDVDGRYMFVSRGFEQAYGRTRSELLGHTDYDLTSSQFAASFRAHDQRILALSEPIVVEEDVKTHDGTLVTYLSSKFPLRNADGMAYAVCGISTNITDRKKAEQEIALLLEKEQAARAEAEAASRAKDEFLSVLSHELRTPLTSVLGWISLLRTNRLDAETAAQALETIERNAHVQVNLVEDLLDVSRIISGKLSVELHPLNPATVIEAAANAIRPTAENKDIRLELELGQSPISVLGDANRLQQVVSNLLSNAIKFTPKNGHVEVRLVKHDSYVRIEVQDSGQGIAAEFLPQVFDHFRQADSSSTRRHGGLGLGLAIVRHIVQLHGGGASVQSEGEGHGATFIVQLPVAERASQSAPANDQTASSDQTTSSFLANDLAPSPTSANGHASDKNVVAGDSAVAR